VVKPPFRTKTLSTKVSEEEFRDLEAVASKGGLTLSEWCREALLASLNGQEPKSANDSAATARWQSWRSWWRSERSCSMCSSGKRTAKPSRLRRCKG